MTDSFLNKVYAARSAEETRDLYDRWSSSYDAEVAENGYATPGRAAKALAKHVEPAGTPILDFGCGTGLSGLALKLAGFEVIDGMDISPDMIAEAEAKNVYRTLTKIDPDRPLPFEAGDYTAIAAVGVIGPGAGPIGLLDRLIEKLDRSGVMVFSLNDHALADRAYKGRVYEYLDTGTMRLLHHGYGPHLPGLKLKSSVYVLEKA